MTANSISSDLSGVNSLLGQTSDIKKKEDPLGRDAFLTMLVAQLKNQDPLNPMQGSDFSAQLAQFSSLEQLFNVNDNLESIKGSVADTNSNNELLNYIGKTVLSKSDTFTLKDGQAIGGNYELTDAASIVIRISDTDGNPVRELKMGHQEPGSYQVKWDGIGPTGERYINGDFKYTIYSVGQNGMNSLIDAGVKGKITGITFDQGAPYLLMGTQLVAPSSITKVWQEASDA
jgi:flagellar basal-body rod modification protein FlgD